MMYIDNGEISNIGEGTMAGTIKSAQTVADTANLKAETAVADSAKADAKLAEAKAEDAKETAVAARKEADKVT